MESYRRGGGGGLVGHAGKSGKEREHDSAEGVFSTHKPHAHFAGADSGGDGSARGPSVRQRLRNLADAANARPTMSDRAMRIKSKSFNMHKAAMGIGVEPAMTERKPPRTARGHAGCPPTGLPPRRGSAEDLNSSSHSVSMHGMDSRAERRISSETDLQEHEARASEHPAPQEQDECDKESNAGESDADDDFAISPQVVTSNMLRQRSKLSTSLDMLVRQSNRPKCASPCKEDDFCLVDESRVAHARLVLKNLCVSEVWQASCPVVHVSHGLEQLSGFSAREVVGCDASVVHTWRGEEQGDVAAAMAEGRAWAGLGAVHRKDGDEVECAVFVVPVADPAGGRGVRITCFLEVVGGKCLGSSLDDNLMQSIQKQVEALTEAVMITEPGNEGNSICFLSAGHERLSGYKREDVLGCSWTCEFGKGTSPEDVEKMYAAVHAGEAFSAPMLQYRKEGAAYWAYSTMVPLRRERAEGAAKGHLWMKGDVTYPKTRRVRNYVLGRVIGAGSSGTVRIARNHSSKEKVAIKVVDASKFTSITEIECVQEEIRILQTIKHENIINLIEVLFIHNKFYFVMEFAEGGPLTSALKNGPVPEERARELLTCALKGVEYCHRRNIVHRDLKSENLLLDGAGSVKVADFGLSTVLTAGAGMSLMCGTPAFQAPEIFLGLDYSPAVDIWSMGVILYELVCGCLPFEATSRRKLRDLVVKGSYTIPDSVSKECENLIARMLTLDPIERITIAELWRHPWFGLVDDCLDQNIDIVDTSKTEPPSSAQLDVGSVMETWPQMGGHYSTTPPRTANSTPHHKDAPGRRHMNHCGSGGYVASAPSTPARSKNARGGGTPAPGSARLVLPAIGSPSRTQSRQGR